MHRGSWFAVALVLVAAPLSGCTGGVSSKPSFTLEPDRIGWNVTDLATFTLALKPNSPPYTIDPTFAVQWIELDTGGVGGDFKTDRPEDLGLEILVRGVVVREAVMEPAVPEVTLRFRLPEELKDDAYTLEVSLFQAGEVESEAFRVNRP